VVFIQCCAICNNQSETSIAACDIWKFQTKLQFIEVLALISAPGISTVANDSRLLLGYISPSGSDVSGLIYVDCMINFLVPPLKERGYVFRSVSLYVRLSVCLYVCLSARLSKNL